MATAAGLGPELYIEEMMLLVSQSLAKMEVSEHYEVIRDLGSGTFGKVQLVRHRFRGTMMALKLLAKSRTQMRRFLREYSMSLYLSAHPFITKPFGIAFESHDHYAFVQEYAPVGDLFELIQPQVGIPEAAAKRCALQVAMALEHLHGRSLVHRDVKPENILLFDRECRRVKLADFGLVRRTGVNVRQGGSVVPYMAPELCDEDAQKVGSRVGCAEDVWAFGVVVYSILTGYFPWERTSAEDPLYRAFARWQREAEPQETPPQWTCFTREARQMLKGFLALQAKDRSPVKEVMAYLKLRWIADSKAKPSGDKLQVSKELPVNTGVAIPASIKENPSCATLIVRESANILCPKQV
ncbi:serine/threonine-protein kinase SBK1-like [Heterodontus francisci]|uniref:serine/threonine-protein kinase SBK1-like n=1 Tax=Heterodontus francisci TaxID=7792 RepID=UPI00355ADB57